LGQQQSIGCRSALMIDRYEFQALHLSDVRCGYPAWTPGLGKTVHRDGVCTSALGWWWWWVPGCWGWASLIRACEIQPSQPVPWKSVRTPVVRNTPLPPIHATTELPTFGYKLWTMLVVFGREKDPSGIHSSFIIPPPRQPYRKPLQPSNF